MSIMEGGTRTRGRQVTGTPDQPLVSIVTVVFNGAATLERTLKSVREQDHPHIEHIVVDGGSTDGTVDLLRAHDTDLAYWSSTPDKGIYDGMNKGLSLCRGEWVGLINADDWYEPGIISRMMHEAQGRDAVNILHGDIWIHYPNGTRRKKRARNSSFLLRYWEMVLNHPSFFVRNRYYASHRFDPSFRVSGDHLWTLRAHLEDPAQFHYVPVPVANFSAGGASMSVPLGKVLREGARVSRAAGMGPGGVLMGHLVRTALHVPQYLKLLANQYLSSGK